MSEGAATWLLVGGTIGAAALVLALIIGYSVRQAAKARRLMREGRPAAVVVLGVTPTGQANDRTAKLHMTYRFDPGDGSPSFQVAKDQSWPHASAPAVGNRLVGFYDPSDHRRFGVVPVDGPGVLTALEARSPQAAEIAREIYQSQLRSGGLTDADLEEQERPLPE